MEIERPARSRENEMTSNPKSPDIRVRENTRPNNKSGMLCCQRIKKKKKKILNTGSLMAN
jgi:hypothetical protein